MFNARPALVGLALALVAPVPVTGLDADPVNVDGDLDSLDEIIAVVTTLLEPVGDGDLDGEIESPTNSEPMAGPSNVWVSATYFTGIDVTSLTPPTIGADDPSWFHHVPTDFAYYGTDGAFVAYQVVVEVGSDWQDVFSYFEVGVGLSKPELAGAVAMPGIDNDPFVGVERSNSYVWGGGVSQAVTGFAQADPGLNLFQSPYVTAGTPFGDSAYAVTMLIPDPTYVPRFVVSWGDGVDIGSVGFLAIDGDALGTQDGFVWDPAEAPQIATAFAAFVADFGDADPPDEEGATSEGTAGSTDGETVDADDGTAATADQADDGVGVGAEEPSSPDEADPLDEEVATSEGTAGSTDGEAVGGAGTTDTADESDGGGPWVFIVGGFVLVVIVGGGTWWFVWGNRGDGTKVVPPTSGEDRTESTRLFRSHGEKVPLDAAYLGSDALHLGGLPPQPPLSEIASLITRAEALGLPNLDGWQLLEFDLAFDVLTRDDTRWAQLSPPDTPIDGNQIGIWLDPVEGFRIGTPDDPHAFITPPEHALPPKPSPDTEPAAIPEMGEVVMAGEPSLDLNLDSPVRDEADPAPNSDGDDGAPWWGDGAPPVGPRDSFVPATGNVEDGGEGPQQATIALLKYGETGIEADKLGRLEDIIRRFRGTGDIAGTAEALFEFNEWHTQQFDESWFEWTNDTTEDTLSMAISVDDFFMARKMSCFEFIHFCSYLASDQPARPKVDEAGNQVGQIWAWGLHERVFRAELAVPGGTEVPRGQAVTGVARWLTGVNKAGYTHIVVSLGDGQMIGLGTDGLEKETVDECFSSYVYEDLQHGPYRYGGMNAAPTGGGGN